MQAPAVPPAAALASALALAAAPAVAQTTPAPAPAQTRATMVVEWTRLKALPGERANLTAFIHLNWFAMDAKAVEQGLFTSYRLIANPAEGGDSLLWQHLFWFFGHPEVYIIFVPALGMVSAIIATFTQRPILGYQAMVLSLVATGFIGFGLWVHHMFATGLPQLGLTYFTAASMMIAEAGSIPKVIGSRIAIPAVAPIPGSTPSAVPMRQPISA